MTVKIKRERWGNRLVVVARDNGKIVTWRKWSRTATVSELQQTFKKNQTFRQKIERFTLTNVVETSDFTKRPRFPRGVTMGQAVARANINGEVIAARSLQREVPFNVNNATDEAIESLYERISVRFGGGYTAEEGQQFADSENIMIETGIVYYTARRR